LSLKDEMEFDGECRDLAARAADRMMEIELERELE
jgi:hypothetical protein